MADLMTPGTSRPLTAGEWSALSEGLAAALQADGATRLGQTQIRRLAIRKQRHAGRGRAVRDVHQAAVGAYEQRRARHDFARLQKGQFADQRADAHIARRAGA